MSRPQSAPPSEPRERRGAGCGGAPWDNANFARTPPGGQLQGGLLDGLTRGSVAVARMLRYARQEVARRILAAQGAVGLFPNGTPRLHRLCYCNRALRGSTGTVDIRLGLDTGKAFYTGLQTCGSVWVCPVCAAKISERRREELKQAIQRFESGPEPGAVLLLTVTSRHTKRDALAPLLDAQDYAWALFLKRRPVRRLFAKVGFRGMVRAREVTHGRKAHDHGWHPHNHVALFQEWNLDLGSRERFVDELLPHWIDCNVKAGLAAPDDHGIHLMGAGEAAVYAAKLGLELEWGIAEELTRGHTKKAAEGKGETPFQFLDAIAADPQDLQARALYLEYIAAFRGKQQLAYSVGLRELLGLQEERTDAEVAAADPDELSRLYACLEPEHWRFILSRELRGEVLHAAERLEAPDFALWLLDLISPAP